MDAGFVVSLVAVMFFVTNDWFGFFGFLESPVRVTTCLECPFNMRFLIRNGVGVTDNGVSAVVKGADDT